MDKKYNNCKRCKDRIVCCEIHHSKKSDCNLCRKNNLEYLKWCGYCSSEYLKQSIINYEKFENYFMNSYQPERSKRKDSLTNNFICPTSICGNIIKEIDNEMRCSEHCGNTVREAQ